MNSTQQPDLITKVTRIFSRKDGSEARIVVENFAYPWQKRALNIYVHRRESPDHSWKLCSDKPHPDWKSMTVDDYVKHGRAEMLQAVTWGEILKLSGLIGKPMSCVN